MAKKLIAGKQTTKADTIFSLIIRAPGYCAECGSHYRLQCAHGFSRRYRNVRWDERNAWCLCSACHMRFTHRPLEWDEWMLDRMGASYEVVRRLALSGEKPDVVVVLELLSARWKELQHV